MSENERMVREINKLGGYVYPVEVKLYNGTYNSPGMMLRDYFAAYALMGLMSAHTTEGQWTATGTEEYAAVSAYRAADAMLEARK